MEFRHLRSFVAVAEELHFGRAAARVHIVQPALSRQIRALEDEIGIRLFERDRRRVALTQAGTAFLNEARSLLEHADRAVEAARRADRGELGTLRIAYVPAMVSTGLPEIVRSFRQRYPGVDVRLQEMTPATQVEALLGERLDVGFVRGPIREPALATQTVLEEPLVAALPSGHRLGSHKRLRIAALTDEPFVLQARSAGPGSHDHILAVCQSAGFSPRVVQEGSQAEVASLVASGAGVALVPASLQAIRRAGVLYRPLHERPMTQLDMAWRKDAASPVLRAFLAEVQQSARSIQPKAR
jgi:DNA-binding transcriptional LysR family regulator